MRRVLLLSGLALLLGASTADAASRTVKVPANFVYVSTSSDSNCTWGIGIRFSAVSGASSYLVKYYDGYYKQLESRTVAPKDVADPQGGKGTLFFGVTGGGYSPPCGDANGDATGGGRFSKGATVYAMFPRPVIKVSGTVRRSCPGRCTARPQLAGVTITGRRKSGGSASAVTGADGSYLMILRRKGDWTFTPRGLNLGFKPKKRVLKITNDRSGVNFTGCGGSTSSLRSPFARSTQLTPGTYSNRVDKAKDDDCIAYLVFFVTVEPNGSITAIFQVEPIGGNVFSYDFELKNPQPGPVGLNSKKGQAFLRLIVPDTPSGNFQVQRANAEHTVAGKTTTIHFHTTNSGGRNTFNDPPVTLVP